jgi:hypothetical protein
VVCGEWSADSKTTLHSLLSTFEEMKGGGEHEETEKNESLEGSLEEKKC